MNPKIIADGIKNKIYTPCWSCCVCDIAFSVLCIKHKLFMLFLHKRIHKHKWWYLEIYTRILYPKPCRAKSFKATNCMHLLSHNLYLAHISPDRIVHQEELKHIPYSLSRYNFTSTHMHYTYMKTKKKACESSSHTLWPGRNKKCDCFTMSDNVQIPNL